MSISFPVNPCLHSSDNYESGCGWPNLTKPIDPANIKERRDVSHGMTRTEIRSTFGDTDLGDVFDDGSRDQGGLRYGINGRVTVHPALEADGYAAYLNQMESNK
jgi:peptide-methionine (R)-S-oxide reductase